MSELFEKKCRAQEQNTMSPVKPFPLPTSFWLPPSVSASSLVPNTKM